MNPKTFHFKSLLAWSIMWLFYYSAGAQLTPGISADGQPLQNGDTLFVCQGHTVNYSSTAIGNTSTGWTFLGGKPHTSVAIGPAVKYDTLGLFSTTQLVSNIASSVSMSVYVLVSNTHPDSSFVFSPNNVCGNDSIRFISTGAGYLNYLWDFNDNTTGPDNDTAYHQFLNAIGLSGIQIYNVKLTVTDNFGCSSSKTLPVTVRKIPDASIDTAAPGITRQVYDGLTSFGVCDIKNPSAVYPFKFKNTSTTIPINSSYLIRWGDGISPDSTFTAWNITQPITHNFPFGNSVMTIEIKDALSGCTGIRKYNVFVGSVAEITISRSTPDICENQTDQFTVRQYEDDPPGTIYYYRVPGLIANTVFDPRVNNVITLTFSKTSCGQPENVWNIKVFSENFCGPSAVNLPVAVSQRPQPNMSLSPNASVACLNSAIIIRNNTTYANTISGNVSTGFICGNASLPIQAWRIFPSSGYTVTGNLGSFANGNIVTPGDLQISSRFTVPGAYTIRLYINSQKCGIDSIDHAICVRNPPDANFSLIQQAACSPATISLSKTNLAGECAGDTLLWAFTYSDPLSCRKGLDANPHFLTGSATSPSSTVQFNAPGIYIVKLTVLSKNGDAACAASKMDTFTVKGRPTVKISPLVSQTICVNSSINISATAGYCYTSNNDPLQWSFPGGVPLAATGPTVGPITYADTGLFLIKVLASSECGQATDSIYVHVVGIPVIDAGTDKTICSGNSANIHLTSSLPGSTFSWTSTVNTGDVRGNTTGTNRPDTIIKDILVNYGTTIGTVTYVITSAVGPCKGTPVTVTITILPAAIANAGPDQVLCDGIATAFLAGNIPAAGTVLWHQVAGPSSTIVNENSPNTEVNGLVVDSVYIFTYTVNGLNSDLCPAIDTVKIVSRPPITPANAGPDFIKCDSTFSVYRLSGNLPVPKYETGTWYWDITKTTMVPFPVLPLAQIHNPNAVITGLSQGQAVLIWKINNDGNCPPTTDTVVISINKSIPPNAGMDTTICNKGMIQLTGTPSGGTWSGAGVSLSGLFNPQLTGNGNYTLYYTTGSDPCIGRDSVIVTVIDAPVVFAGVDKTVCASLDTFSVHGTPAGGIWSGSLFVTAAGIFTPGNPGTYELYYTAGTGTCKSIDTVKITVATAILNNLISPNQAVCGNVRPGIINGEVASGGIGIISYQWQSSIDSLLWEDIPGATTLSYQPAMLNLTTYFRRVAISTLCASAGNFSKPVKIVVFIKPVSTIISDSVGCIGYPVFFKALVQPVDSIASSVWDFGNGVITTGNNVSTTYNQPGTYLVRMISRTLRGCADTVYKSIHVYVSPFVNAGRDVKICRGDSTLLGVTGATIYSWSPINGLSCANCAKPVAKPLFTTQYIVSGSNGNGCISIDTILVEVIQPFTLIVSPNDSICLQDTTQLFANANTIVSYLWSPPAGLSATSIPNPLAYPHVTTNYIVTATDPLKCFTVTKSVVIAVGQKPVVDLGPNRTVVIGENVRLDPRVTNGPVKNYLWSPVVSCGNCQNPSVKITTDIVYKLEVENVYGCTGNASVTFYTTCISEDDVFIPSAFTPSAPPNNLFMIRSRGMVPVAYFRIFNKWGQMLFERNGIYTNDVSNAWDGKVNGNFANPGVYIYTAKIVCPGGKSFEKKGNVTLIR